ncbi:anaerobic ribonucleoside-triphosphate reductase [Escherichia coli]
MSVTRRVCGYLGSPDARPFNAGKQEEVKRRVWLTLGKWADQLILQLYVKQMPDAA